MHFPWFRIPFEIAHEIAGHNADDGETLRAMSLVSHMTRSLVVKHIFATIHFACVEDFARWLDILGRTPILRTAVKKVKFSTKSEAWLRLHRGLESATPLWDYTVPPLIPSSPSVYSVEWRSVSLTPMMVAHMALFPNVKRLHLNDICFTFAQLANLLRRCKRLASLSFHAVTPDIYDWKELPYRVSRQTPIDLGALENLAVIGGRSGRSDAFLHLIQQCGPVRLKSLDIEDFVYQESRSVKGIARLLHFVAPFLVNLVLEVRFPDFDDEEVLPVFEALESLTLWMKPYHPADRVINALTAAPNLAKLVFRVDFYRENKEALLGELDSALGKLPRWRAPESLKTVLARKFPRCQRVEFHLRVSHDSDLHFRRKSRRGVERHLRDRLKETQAGIEELLQIEWVDGQYDPVKYSQTTGKPPWKFGPQSSPHARHEEPETESSDDESVDSNSNDGDAEE
ncbi:hypothetical protein K438DRAFT_1870057 [Mycena galopus ATCC 62051]|nr:hypothetical protein K438DRAFT_1870057 [Mycena galopus ATCC 62051]